MNVKLTKSMDSCDTHNSRNTSSQMLWMSRHTCIRPH